MLIYVLACIFTVLNISISGAGNDPLGHLYKQYPNNVTIDSSENELLGLWEAKRRFGPDVSGTLFIKHANNEWSAEISGNSVKPIVKGDTISFELPGDQGSFRGFFKSGDNKITGHWFQPWTVTAGVLASPVILTKYRANIWKGNVQPYEDEITCYLMVKLRSDGTLRAFIRNPERNIGRTQYPVDYIEREGELVKFYAANKDTQKGRLLAEGRYDSREKRLLVYLPNRGGTYDFRRLSPDEFSNFYPRGRPNVKYIYTPPPKLDDGWQTASLEDVGISKKAIESFIQMVINTQIDSVNAMEDHGILIARYGKLVLEEYFHGESREKPHDTRSASKSVASDLMGAAINSGVEISASSYVYKVMNGGKFPPNLEARKMQLKVEHLLTMSSGFDCDENNSDSPGFEDNMWEQTEQPDYYKWTLDLKMIHDPGEMPVYCSAGSNLVGGVISRAANQPSLMMFQKLLAEPLEIKRYHAIVLPTGDIGLTGGVRFLPRDFMKLGQVHISGGTWNGKRIYSEEWSDRATTSLCYLSGYKLNYGYLWWVTEYDYKGRKLKAYFASGNGGQIVMAIPELELVLAFYGGNYNAPGGRTAQRIYVPKYILPAIEDGY